MRLPKILSPKVLSRKKPTLLAVVVLFQAAAVLFFVGDSVADFTADGLSIDNVFEAFVALALIFGVVAGGMQLRSTLETVELQARALTIARHELSKVIQTQFTQWGLTAAEREVALFALKGMEIAEIAEMRGSAQGTVRAQLAKVYAKAGVSSRTQFAAHFVEDLLS